jgi:pantoate--beta-alanine ligase
MSSRNRYLSADERRRALAISQSLAMAQAMVRGGERRADAIAAAVRSHLVEAGQLQVDYVAVADPHTLAPLTSIEREAVVAIAARVGATRLIDNFTVGADDPNGPI